MIMYKLVEIEESAYSTDFNRKCDDLLRFGWDKSEIVSNDDGRVFQKFIKITPEPDNCKKIIDHVNSVFDQTFSRQP